MYTNGRIPIMEEDDDELQSAGGSKYIPPQKQYTEREK